MKKSSMLKENLLNSFIPVILSILFGGVIILMLGENPLHVYGILIEKSLLTEKGFMNTLHYASPLILTGLAIAITFKANIYNMGVEGQMVFGGFFAGIVGTYLSDMNGFVAKLICFLVAIFCGMCLALIPALLKIKCNVNEMVVTLMLNYAILKLLEFLTTGIFRDTNAGYVATKTIEKNVMFRHWGHSRLTSFFILSMIVLIFMYFVFHHSKLGYEITAIGKNAEFAEATGMNVGRKILLIMLISGALSGMAGAGWMMSDQFKFTLGFSSNPGLGWDGMLIALLGGHSPIGVFVAAVFYSVLKTGSDSINMYTNVPKEMIAMIQGIMILFLAVKFVHQIKERVKPKKAHSL